jgi:hypothetical protein
MKHIAVRLAHTAVVSLAFGIVSMSCAPGTTPTPHAGDAAPMAEAGIGCVLGGTMAEIEQKLFHGPKCLVCHQKMTLFPTSFDMMSDNLAARVVDKEGEADPNKGKCAHKILVPRDNPTGGIFVEKVEKAMPSCGDRMPQSMAALSTDEITCVRVWATLAAQSVR